jgi:holo-[acyl-carrier protein] synthase
MIKGMGIDIAEVERIKRSVEKFKENFISRIFTEKEQQLAENRKDFATFYAGRWAAKEAISKALGCGIGEQCSFTDIEILNDANGKPEAELKGNALETFKKLNAEFLHITISHEGKNAVAMAIIE